MDDEAGGRAAEQLRGARGRGRCDWQFGFGTAMWPRMAKANVTAGLAWPPDASAAMSTASAWATAVATRDEASDVDSGGVSIPAGRIKKFKKQIVSSA